MIKRVVKKVANKCNSTVKHKFPYVHENLKRTSNALKAKRGEYQDLLLSRYERLKPSDEKLVSFEDIMKKRIKVYSGVSKATSIKHLLEEVVIEPEDRTFLYNIDVFKCPIDGELLMVNSTMDYESVINRPLSDFRMEGTDKFVRENNIVVDALINYLHRLVKYVEDSTLKNRDNIAIWLSNMENGKVESFPEALQRILFMNMVLWQTNHRLVGLGRLDLILEATYQNDSLMTKETATEYLMDFFTCLHDYYWFKSNEMLGDTGQITILGGNQKDGGYFCNDLTYAFIDAVRLLQIPDPKALLRVGENTPKDLFGCALDCISTGIGSPLFSNDEKVIPAMIEFGYETEDAYNYVTSACWEPMVPAIAHEQNNISLFNFLLPIELADEKEGLERFDTFEEMFDAYCAHLRGHVSFMIHLMEDFAWEDDPLVSAFTSSCREKHIDIGKGGGKYNNYGILSVAMVNAVNSLLILKKYVFEKKMFTLAELNLLRKNDFRGHEDVRKFLLQQRFYGTDDPEAVELTNKILDVANDEVGKYRNPYGGRYKFGLSSPGYILAAEDFPASFDGRKYGDPFAVHISGDDGLSVTELMKFASKLDYTKSRFNGNVVDFFVSPNLLENQKEKFADFIKTSLEMGVFQTQMNVVSSKTLSAARKNPEAYPNLIVRVWGFSAYYVDLPDEYKDYLIERAIKCENAA